MQTKYRKLYLALRASLAVPAAVGLFVPSAAEAASWNTRVAVGNWETSTTWTPLAPPGPPGPADNANINRGAGSTVNFTNTTGTRSVTQLQIGASNNNKLNQTGGNLTVPTISLAGNGQINASGGKLTATNTTLISTSQLNVSSTADVSSNNITLNSGTSLNVTGGAFTSSSQVTIASGGAVNISGGSATANVISNSGALSVSNGVTNNVTTLNVTGGTVSLTGTNSKLSVSTDYNNSNFGLGNSFSRFGSTPSTNVTGTGSIIAAEANTQILTGAKVSNGGTSSATLNLGNIHVTDATSSANGSDTTTQNFQIANTASTLTLRGAVQTSAPGTFDSRLSTGGISLNDVSSPLSNSTVSQNYTTNGIAAGKSSSNIAVTFTGATAGAIDNSKSSITVVDNFGQTQTLTVTGEAWRLASASETPTSVNLGNIHVGDSFGSQNISLQNTASNADIYSEKLNASISVSGLDDANASGSVSGLSAGTTNSTGLSVSLGNTGSAGAKSGTATISLVSDGGTSGTAGNSGLGTTALTSQSVTVQGEVWRLASASATPTSVNFGNIHVGGTFGSQAISLKNTATNDNYSEKLNASISVTGLDNAIASGSVSGLSAGTTNSSGLSVSLDSSSAGAKSGTATISLVSDGGTSGVSGNSGLGTSGLASQSVTVQGEVWRLASASATPTSVNFGNIHVGGTFGSQAISLKNTATNDGYSENLNASISVTGLDDAVASGSVSGLSAGTTNSSGLSVSLDSSSAGAKSGTATISLVSDGGTSGTPLNSGLGTSGLASQSVTVQGEVWRLASASETPTSVNFGNIHVGGTFGSQAISLKNTATNDGYSEKLNASISVTGLDDAVASGSVSGLSAGTTNSSGLSVSLDSSSAGAKSGTATISLVSDGGTSGVSGNSGLGTSGLASQSVTVQGEVWRLASASETPSSVNLTGVHVGGTFGSQNITLKNTAVSSDIYSEKLNASISSAGDATGSGSVSALSAGSTDSTGLSVSLTNTGTAGVKSGTATISLVSDGGTSGVSGNSGLGTTGLASQAVSVTGTVYNYAEAALKLNSASTSGVSFTSSDSEHYTLNFHLAEGTNSGNVIADLGVLNTAVGPADKLLGTWDFSSSPTGSVIVNYALADILNTPPNFGIAAGGHSIDGTEYLDIATNTVGTYSRTIKLTWNGYNGNILNGLGNLGWSGTDVAENAYKSIFLTINGDIYSAGVVSEPGTLWLFGAAGLSGWAARRRKAAKQEK